MGNLHDKPVEGMRNVTAKEIAAKSSEIDYTKMNDDIFVDREKYYLGNVNQPLYMKMFEQNPKIFVVDSNILLMDPKEVPEGLRNYFVEMQNFYRLYKNYAKGNPDPKFLFFPGDVNHSAQLPILTKTRPSGNPGLGVLLPLNIPRHWAPINEVERHDIPFNMKKDRVVWRGVGTGVYKRAPLVEQYYRAGAGVETELRGERGENFDAGGYMSEYKKKSKNETPIEIDVGFTGFQKNYPGRKDDELVKQRITIPEMLKNKYLISVEGNDVASNLKWILSSQSVCIKPPARTVSWLMEDRLVPWVHYVPVRQDFADLREKLEWCRTHPRKCQEIIKAANDYMNRFKSGDEKTILKVLKGYTDMVNFVG